MNSEIRKFLVYSHNAKLVYSGRQMSQQRYPCFDIVVGLRCQLILRFILAVATGRASNAIQVKSDYPGKNGHPGPPCWRLGVRLPSPPIKMFTKPKEGQSPPRR